jgi:hypothetical protein
MYKKQLSPPVLNVSIGRKETTIFLSFCLIFIGIGIGIGYLLWGM